MAVNVKIWICGLIMLDKSVVVELLVFDKSLLSWDNPESAGENAKEAK